MRTFPTLAALTIAAIVSIQSSVIAEDGQDILAPVLAAMKEKNPDFDGKAPGTVDQAGQIKSFNFASKPIKDLSPLKGLALTVLYLQSTKVSDLSPLQGMPLDQLYLNDS